jgi:glycolate oxidase iron-sulfur subunit
VPSALNRRLSLPPLPIRPERLMATGDDVWLFTGCVTDAWQRPVHRAAIAVVGAMGAGVALPGPAAGCCGALSAHGGLRAQTFTMGRRVMSAFPGDQPILVDSAGCGATLKDYGRVFGSESARRFSARVQDIHEWMAGHADALPAPAGRRRLRVAVQDPCHLRHVQRAERHVRTVLSPYAELVELTDEGRCCGAGGSYSVLQPTLATAIRDQKIGVIKAARADVVASANPGCSMWLAAAGVPVMHPVEIIAESAGLSGG